MCTLRNVLNLYPCHYNGKVILLKCNLTPLFYIFSTNAALEIFALDLSNTDLEMPLKGTVSSEHRYINF